MSEDEAEYQAFLKQRKKDKILIKLQDVKSTIPVELAGLTGFPVGEVENLLDELADEELVENVSGAFYHLTFDGWKYSKALRSSKKWRGE